MWQNPLNHPIFSRLSLRNKLLLAGLAGFLLGSLLRGGSGGIVGRYQFHPGDPKLVIDTVNGVTFRYSDQAGDYKRLGSIPWH